MNLEFALFTNISIKAPVSKCFYRTSSPVFYLRMELALSRDCRG